ncbi:mitochondrial import receptor subunit TOM20 homolog isoform X2 [Planococcus citri]
MTWSKLGIAAAVCGSVAIGYCIYFDRKRRSDPDFKKKLREKRKARSQAEKAAKSARKSQFPDFRDHEAVQTFFLQQIQLGEELLGQGKIDECVEHIANAVSVCGQPQQLLSVLQQTLPPTVFGLLLERLPASGQKLLNHQMGMKVEDVDVE